MASTARFCLVSSCRISHFGPKPVSGGRPARESIIRGVNAVKTGDLVHAVASTLIEVAFVNLKRLNTESVIRIYVRSAIRVSGGQY